MTKQIALALLSILLGSATSLAVCASPAGIAGQIQWIASASAVKYCNGTSWVDTSSTVGAACTSGEAGKILFSSSEHRYCNGTNWISMKGTSTGVSCTSTGKLEYDSATSKLKGCMGGTWEDTTAATGTSYDSTHCPNLLQGSTCDADPLCETGSLGCYAKCDYSSMVTCEGDPACNWDSTNSYCLDPNQPVVTEPGGGGAPEI